MSRINPCNIDGISYDADNPQRKVQRITVHPESDTVQVWIKTLTEEVLVYLDPEEAMAFSNAFARCAIQALKEKAG